MQIPWYLWVGIPLILYSIYLYNRLIGVKNEIDNMMGSIDAILKKRFDLISNLVSAVREYSVFERSLLEKLTEIRSFGIHTDMSIHEKSSLSTSISDALRQFNLTVENYPALKANSSFLHLQKTIAILEEELSASRRAYNQTVTDYNNQCEMFPSSLMAAMMDLKAKEVFKAEQNEQSVPELSALFQPHH